ncbi:SDR family oxidoreductase [Curtobacterium sp. VKM Ac-2865]|uniref:SDR family oxidoreductase n=1 Tax=Curtobacterium sp. VKM Ac-2865 TaxID=2783817 RepID=UPI00188A8BB2|nr:SDR family oxidoreductase [Curtobacterium sp. VKM Ac-2865]MBF4582334.1 SDR family oxidoreductase [Curtobacterium sp. VKM Ac-2865]
MNIADSTVLITGANRGLGAVFLEQALARGASKVYAASRTPGTWDDPRVVPLRIDVTDEQTILDAAQIADDVTLVINNAGIANHAPFATGDIAAIRADMDTNFWGPVLMTRAFAPVLTARGGGTVLNVLSAAAWMPLLHSYSASKAAMWSATNSMRSELLPQGIHVVDTVLGFVRTEMSTEFVGLVAMIEADFAVNAVYDQLEAGRYEIIVDDTGRDMKQLLTLPPEEIPAAFGGLQS